MLDSLKQKKNFKRIKMRIKTGDLVKVINGKEKGKTGEVLKTIPLENRVVVKGVNLRTKHVKPTQEGESGRILTEEASLHASNVMFFSDDRHQDRGPKALTRARPLRVLRHQRKLCSPQ